MPLGAVEIWTFRRSGRHFPHGLKRVAHEIDQCLLELNGVAVHRGQILRQRHVHGAKLRRGLRPHHVRHALDDLVDADPPAERAPFLDRVPHVLDDFVGALPSAATSWKISWNWAASPLPFSMKSMPALALLVMAESG